MSTYSTSSIPQGIQIYANATLFPVTAQDGEQAVAADTNTLYIYDTSIPGWQAVANPGAAIAIDALTGDVTATGPGVVAATIANAAVTNAKLAAMADNTVKGNKSGAPASPSDLTLSNLTESTSNVLTITNGSKAIIATSDLTIQVKQSGAAQDGYLSSSDWSSFNAKLVSINGDTTPAQTISAGTGISVGTAAGVTTVTNTAPMAATGNLTEATSSVLTISGGTGAVIGAGGTTIQVLQSGAAQSGYLSSGDWSTFNSKVSSVSGSAPISSSGGTTPTISITQSGAATNGYLSSTDWNTFNNAASSVAAATALSTPSTLMARDASGETALDGLSLDGSTSGSIKLQAAATTTSYTVKMPSAQGAASTFLQNDGSGNLSWTAVPSPYPAFSSDKVLYSTASAAEWRTVGTGSTDAAYPANTIILGRAKPTSFTTANNNIIISTATTNTMTSAQNNIVMGTGGNALTSGGNTILLGDYGSSLASGTEVVAIGWKSTGTGISGGSVFQSVAIGTRGVCGSNCVSIGDIAQASSTSVAIGSSCGNNGGSNGVTVGNSAGGFGTSRIVCIGNEAVARGGGDGVSVGYRAGGAGVGTDTGGFNTCVGSNAGFGMNNVSAARNVFLGYMAGRRNTTQADELFIDNQDRTTYANQQTKSLLYGTFNATETSQRLRINAQTQLAYGEKHASLHGQTGTLDVITALTSNYYIGVDCSLAAKTVNLPAAATAGQGFVLVIKDESGSAATNNITIDASGAELIDGAATQLINANYGSLSLICSGTAWFLAP